MAPIRRCEGSGRGRRGRIPPGASTMSSVEIWQETATMISHHTQGRTSSKVHVVRSVTSTPSRGQRHPSIEFVTPTGPRPVPPSSPSPAALSQFHHTPIKPFNSPTTPISVSSTSVRSNPSPSLFSNKASLFSARTFSSAYDDEDLPKDELDEEEKQGDDDDDLVEYEPALYTLEHDPVIGLHPSWLKAMGSKLLASEFVRLYTNLRKLPSTIPGGADYDYKAGEKPERVVFDIYPRYQDLYSWSRLTPLDQVKVVILGNQPIVQPNRSHGLAYSQPAGSPLTGTIRNIHKKLSIEYPHEFAWPDHGSLVSWAKAGVLLLNIHQTVCRGLGVTQGEIGWERFTDLVLDAVDRWGGSCLTKGRLEGLVFLCWGELSRQLVDRSNVPTSTRNHLILYSAHPGPKTALLGFFDEAHFRAANEFLAERYGVDHQIDWCNLEPLDVSC